MVKPSRALSPESSPLFFSASEEEKILRHNQKASFAAQQQAANPRAHIWVSASAGSGKTKVLTDRILNLLIHGVPAHRILCLTFTKAAASEMSHRLLSRLQEWATCSSPYLQEELKNLGVNPLSGGLSFDELEKNARHLFFKVLEDPQGVKIQTLHSFCQTLLRYFPLEVGISPHFSLLDDTQAKALWQKAEEKVFQSTPFSNPLESRQLLESERAQALYYIASHFDPKTFATYSEDFLERSYLFFPLFKQESPLVKHALEKNLEVFLTQDPHLLRQGCLEALKQEPLKSHLQKAARSLKEGGLQDQHRGHLLESILKDLQTSGSTPSTLFEDYRHLYLTDKGDIRARLISKNVQGRDSESAQRLQEEANRMYAVHQKLNSLSIGQSSWSLFLLGKEIFETYEHLKKEKSLLDYHDLIHKTQHLLHQADKAAWILYKLDGAIDHILIDEAQDTNEMQWSIVQALTEEFFSGLGTQNREPTSHNDPCVKGRTLFTVGDPKQSIYSFQGAHPDLFEKMGTYFQERASSSQEQWHKVDLELSFRSTKPILELVDQVFQNPIAAQGVIPPTVTLHHHVYRHGEPGRIDIWPLVSGSDSSAGPLSNPPQSSADTSTEDANLSKSDLSKEDHAWDVNTRVDPPSQQARVILAQGIAHQIRIWLDQKEILLSKGRPIEPQDILILIQRRGHFMEELIRVLKRHQIPVAGADRLWLLDQIAVEDLMALGAFLCLPEDDLTLACVVKSPLFGLTEDDLFKLCHGRSTSSLWQSLCRHQEFSLLADTLIDLLKQVDLKTPFQLFSYVLYALQGRQKFQERLGTEVLETLDAFMNLALSYEKQHPPTLQGFLGWMREIGSQHIKRDLSTPRQNHIRVMTVHGSKGLQAPIVFLPDTVRVPKEQDKILIHPDSFFLCTGSQRDDILLTQALKNHQSKMLEEEYHRLLYVALTRAEERLIIAGWETSQKTADSCWYYLIRQAMEKLPGVHLFDKEEKKIHAPSVEWPGVVLVKEHPASNTRGIMAFSESSPSSLLKRREPNLENDKEVSRQHIQRASPPVSREKLLWLINPAPLEDSLKHFAPSSILSKDPEKSEQRSNKQGQGTEGLLGSLISTDQIPLAPTFSKKSDASQTESSESRMRGIIIHKLLEILPTVPLSHRLTIAHTLVQNHAPLETRPLFSASSHPQENATHPPFTLSPRADSWVSEAIAVLEDSRLRSFFGPNTLGEVPIAGMFEGKLYQGQIDRLVILPKEIWILDFKTTYRETSHPKSIPQSYQRQLSIYKELVQTVYSRHHVRAFLLWTSVRKIVEI